MLGWARVLQLGRGRIEFKAVSIKKIEKQPMSGGFWWSLTKEEPCSIGALALF